MKLHQILVVASCVALASCQKDNATDQSSSSTINSFAEINAPENFDFDASRTLDLTIKVNNTGFTQAYAIEIYDSNPQADGELLFKGFTRQDEISANLKMAAAARHLFVVSTAPDGSQTTEQLEITGSSMTHTFGQKSARRKTVVVSPNCNTGCDNTISSGNWININNAETYCITGNIKGINDNNGNAIIRICGNVTMTGNLSMKGNTELQITDGSTLNVKGINMNSSNGSNGTITVYTSGTLNITGQSFSSFGTIVNHGTINVTKQMYFYGSCTNNGNIHVQSTQWSSTNSPGPITNNGSIVVDGYLTQNSNNTIANHCQLEVKKKFTMNSVVDNYGYIEVDEYHSNSNAALNMDNGAMLYVTDDANGWLNGDITGAGTTSVVKIDGSINSNSSASFSGNLEVCIGGSNGLNASTMVSPAALICDNAYIPTTSCNPEGNGTPTVADADNDNIADDQDEYPNDPDRAGSTYYPGENSFATLAFEDLWPAMGDYDFNDLVLDYRIKMVTDANNDVIDVIIDYKVMATGAGFQNGFGFEFDLAPSTVSSVSRTTALTNLISLNANGTEAGQSKTVLICFDNTEVELPNVGGPFVNTITGSAYSTPTQSQISMTFNTAQDASLFDEWNPFIFVNGDRTKEVHLSGFAPTDLANTNLFGTSSDDSDPSQGRYYVNKNNLPWAINLPVSMEYPAEKNDIVQAYNHFASWAVSGGSANADWYMSTAGYRNNALIY